MRVICFLFDLILIDFLFYLILIIFPFGLLLSISLATKTNGLTISFVLQSKKMKIEVLPTERALIGYLLAKIHKLDPDLIVVSTFTLSQL